MKSIFSKYFIMLFAVAFVLGLAACKQAEEPTEVEEVEVEEVAPEATDMTEPTMQGTAQEMGGTEVEVEETVEETVESVDDSGSAAPESTTEDTGEKAE